MIALQELSPAGDPAPVDDIVESGFFTVAEACAFVRLSRAKLYNDMDAGRLSYCRFGRSRRIPKLSLMRYASAALVSAEELH